MLELQLFEYQNEDHLSKIRTIEINGEIWFIANDVAELLGYKNTSDAISRHCRINGIVKHDMGLGVRNQLTVLINEGNVYRLIIKSKLPSAEKFENRLFEKVVPSIRKKGYYGKIDRTELPNFYERYRDNFHKIDRGYFSVISELFVTLHSEFEKVGYIIPNKSVDGKDIMPDISVGMRFSKYLKKVGSEFVSQRKKYLHSFPDNRNDVEAYMYPLEALPLFRRFVYDEWLPESAEKYLGERDPKVLNYLPKVLKIN